MFTCVLALLLCSLLRRELHRRGFDHSIRSMLRELSAAREVAVVYPARTSAESPRIRTTLSSLSEEQRALFDALDLGRYAST